MCVANVLKKCVNGIVQEEDCAADGKVCSVEPQFNIALCQSPNCTPQCNNKNCGSDGCGGSCGTCAADETCSGAQQCVATTDGSCAGLCNSLFVSGASCQCDALCFQNSDCCTDICTVCATEYASSCADASCESSFDVGPLPFTTSNDTATGSNLYGFDTNTCPGETASLGGGSSEHVWSFTAPTTALYLVTLEAEYDSILYALSSCPVSSGTCLTAHDEIGANLTEFITIDVQANQTVFIVVDGWANSIDINGTYALTVEYSP